ncbi:MAG: AAA family ATPase [Leptospira sp.]|nr:AAA family ATPase [Leptospira sp.]
MNGQIDYFGDYALLELLAESHRSVVFRAAKKESHSTVILKILKREFSSALDLARVKQETKIVQGLLSPGIIRNLGIVQNENSIALILEDTGGISLKEFLSGKPLRYGEFLPVAISLSETLAAIHSQNIIHRDIKPQNIIVNQSNGTITSAKITDFGISTILNEEIREIYNPKTIEGTLPYISPEQTGRMNLSVDYRTDLYSLGVTFYEILSGKFPFSSDDPLTLIHAHIAKEPVLLHELDKSIPVSISGIVQKLLSKSPEDRYQSAYGLKNELEYVRDQLKEKGNVSVFTPGFLDISDRFVMPQKIFGREKEISELMECYSRVTEGQTRIMLVSGVPGIGKSRVVNEIHKPIVKSRGYFISGKYDQLRKDVPFSSILQAFQGLIRQILSESEERIEHWKSSIYNAVGSNAQIIIQVIPEVEIIIGKQPPVPELSPEESQNRFNYCFVNFLKVFSQNYAPLTLFLDDMQWADQPSLNLLRTILSDRTLNHFFLIFSYRDSEMKNSHPFMILVEELKKQNRKINHIHLDSLNSEQVKEFIENLTGKQTKHIYEI